MFPGFPSFMQEDTELAEINITTNLKIDVRHPLGDEVGDDGCVAELGCQVDAGGALGKKISVDLGSLSSKTYFVTVIILGQEFRICDLTNQV